MNDATEETPVNTNPTGIDPATLDWVRSGTDDEDVDSVEIAELPDGGRAMRGSKAGNDGPVLWFTAAEWHAFVLGVRDGEFDIL
ncbi:DUF397 domain-containing protein [Pseudonocardia spinosispora]|uniref:DUF397 domain-containing protein n=1 Tax=Pseudonocardia spinosispora TaxID=103441 RepID=UPI000402DAC0|nr:DUF397 domain-containing protein [Pseudonocardia spinosispora]